MKITENQLRSIIESIVEGDSNVNDIDYRKTSPECQASWFLFKKNGNHGAGTPSAASFVAGWNASLLENSK